MLLLLDEIDCRGRVMRLLKLVENCRCVYISHFFGHLLLVLQQLTAYVDAWCYKDEATKIYEEKRLVNQFVSALILVKNQQIDNKYTYHSYCLAKDWSSDVMSSEYGRRVRQAPFFASFLDLVELEVQLDCLQYFGSQVVYGS